MSRIGQLNSVAASYGGQTILETFDYGVVIEVITDINNERVTKLSKEYDDYVSEKTDLIGAVIVKTLSDPSANKENSKAFFPRNRLNIDLPIVGETVRLFKDGAVNEYERITSYPNINQGNFTENAADNVLDTDEQSTKSKSKNYNEVSKTGTPNSNKKSDSSGTPTNYGEYFTPNKIHNLKLYEGDKLIQSRFGQSIRFSGYNNEEREFSPTIIIRNRENDDDLQEKGGAIIEENINTDGSVIVLSSKNYKSGFDSTIDLTPINAKINKDDGYDQIILNSERIILSSKTQEMLFFSKGDFSIISDSRFTIDGGAGADLDFGDNVNITTDRNNANLTITTGTGNIFLNTTQKNERIVRGDTLVDLLSELIDAINQQVYNTPAGPSAVGPTNRSTFNDIKSKLQDALSTLNYTE
jgi:hypothetical protein